MKRPRKAARSRLGPANGLVPLALVVLFSLAPAPLSAGRVPRYGGDLRVQIAAVPADPDPLQLVGDDGDLIASCVYEGLVRWGDGGLEPALARHWVHDDDSRRWQFHLRPEVLFHDGTRCDAQAVKESLARLADPKQSRFAWILADLEGWDDFAAGRTPELSGIDAPQPDAIELRFVHPVPDLPARLAISAAGIVRRVGAERFGTGPFKLVSTTPEAIRLTAFKDHFSGRPYLDHVDFRSKRDTEIVLWSHVAEMSRSSGSETLPGGALRLRAPAQRLGFALLHPDSQVLSSEDLRRRLAESFDRSVFVRAILSGDGQGASGLAPQPAKLIPSRSADSQGDLSTRPQQRARIMVPASEPVLRALGERLQVYLFALGLNADLDVLPAPAFDAALAARSYDIVVLGWTPPQSRTEDVESALRVRQLLSTVIQPVLRERMPAAWSALLTGPSKEPEAALLRGAHLIPLVFFHDTWQTTADLQNVHLGAAAAGLGVASAHLDPTSQ